MINQLSLIFYNCCKLNNVTIHKLEAENIIKDFINYSKICYSRYFIEKLLLLIEFYNRKGLITGSKYNLELVCIEFFNYTKNYFIYNIL